MFRSRGAFLLDRVQGVVQKWIHHKGYGFVAPASSADGHRVFVSRQGCRDVFFLKEGEEITFDITPPTRLGGSPHGRHVRDAKDEPFCRKQYSGIVKTLPLSNPSVAGSLSETTRTGQEVEPLKMHPATDEAFYTRSARVVGTQVLFSLDKDEKASMIITDPSAEQQQFAVGGGNRRSGIISDFNGKFGKIKDISSDEMIFFHVDRVKPPNTKVSDGDAVTFTYTVKAHGKNQGRPFANQVMHVNANVD